MKAGRGYSGVSDGDDSDEFDSSSHLGGRIISYRGSHFVQMAWSLICVLMFLSGGIMILAAQRWKPSDRECAAQLSIWSPLLEAVEYEERNSASTFTMERSGFTGTPSRQLEAKWKSLVEVPTVVVPPERLPSLNRSAEQGFVPTSPNSSAYGYVAGIEVFHHLHCLNVLRQYAWRDAYPEELLPSLFRYNSPFAVRAHVDHCTETVRLALMCNADVTPYLLYEQEAEPGSKCVLNKLFGLI
ncbi:hypothetical protein N7537_011443 [Penicillium hordei]|uniref:Cyclochlorotine biosynthesis protein O n=1 Tax=Penicillium hordei TaxID=40994 RepID=A0AAD6GU15_9EURO|nr:uncharacterized protein N7537_011443 [Penicillium hordei]KAJ5588765.1 hypothetical protein N7537_011443 [Penicillium hordei]